MGTVSVIATVTVIVCVTESVVTLGWCDASPADSCVFPCGYFLHYCSESGVSQELVRHRCVGSGEVYGLWLTDHSPLSLLGVVPLLLLLPYRPRADRADWSPATGTATRLG